jgi:hypothetical protein
VRAAWKGAADAKVARDKARMERPNFMIRRIFGGLSTKERVLQRGRRHPTCIDSDIAEDCGPTSSSRMIQPARFFRHVPVLEPVV